MSLTPLANIYLQQCINHVLNLTLNKLVQVDLNQTAGGTRTALLQEIARGSGTGSGARVIDLDVATYMNVTSLLKKHTGVHAVRPATPTSDVRRMPSPVYINPDTSSSFGT